MPLKFGIIGLRAGTQQVLQRYLTQWGAEIVFSDLTGFERAVDSQGRWDFVIFGPPSELEKQCSRGQNVFEALRKVEKKTDNIVFIRSIAALKPHPFASYLPNAGYMMEPLRPSAILHFIQTHIHGIDSNGTSSKRESETNAVQALPTSSPRLRERRGSCSSPRGLKVLLVDDNLVNCQVGQRLVKRLNHECHICTSGTQALQQFKAEHYDVVSTSNGLVVLGY